jgi:two-component system, chemotaxis family, protein-glutamate methylesterase/glutaminase
MHRSTSATRRVVCLGSSAGGLQAIKALLANLPAALGISIVVVNHQLPQGRPLLLNILPRHTKMPVVMASHNCTPQPDHVYVIPPNHDVRMSLGTLQLAPRSKTKGWPNVVSIFLKSLAEDQKEKAIAVILSGYGGDGSDALGLIKSRGGTTFAQSFHSAEVPSMPHDAVSTGCVDFLMSPQDIALKLAQIASPPAR